MLNLTPEQWFARLNKKRLTQVQNGNSLWAEYDGNSPMMYVARILTEQQDRFPALRINWPRLVVSSREERLDLDGFRLGGSDEADEELLRCWQENDLDEAATEAHTSSYVTGQSYIMVGPSDGGRYPLITIEYPDQVAVEIDPRTGRVIAALKVWRSDELQVQEDRAILMLPGQLIEFDYGKPTGASKPRWYVSSGASQKSPLVPVSPMLNRPRRGIGYTELADILPLTAAINQTATNMMAAIEHHSLPRRWAIGLGPEDFQDKDGNAIPAWKIATGALWAVQREHPDDKIEVGQFSAADMNNFHASIKQLAQLAGSLYGLPPHYLGYAADNPPSAEAIVYSEARLIKAVERSQRTFGGAWERAMRIALAVMGRDPNEGRQMETLWRDAATPTVASKMDAAVKATGAGIWDTRYAREYTGLTPTQIASMEMRDQNPAAFGSVVAGLRSLDVNNAASG